MTLNGPAWPTVPLKHILKHLDDRVEVDDMTEYVTIRVKRRHGGLEERERLFGHQIKTKKQFRLVPGAFMISRIQCWHQAYAIVPDAIPSNMIASTNYDQFAISPEVDRRFFWWLSFSPLFTETVRSSAFGVVIEKMVFDRDAWLENSIPLPPLAEQRRIVARVNELAAQIMEARRLRQGTLKEAEMLFAAGVTKAVESIHPPWHHVRDAVVEKKNAVRSGPFGSQLHHGEFVPTGVAAIGTQDVQMNRFELRSGWFVTLEKFEQFQRYQVFPGDILCTIVGSIGRFCVVPDGVPLAFTTKHIQALTLDNRIAEPRFVSYVLNFHRRCRESLFSQVEGTAIRSLNAKKILSTELPLPKLAEQHRIVSYLDGLQAKVDALKKLQDETVGELDTLIPSILDKAFKGDL